MTTKPQIVVVGSHAPGLFLRVHQPPVPGETVMGWDFQEPKDGGKGSHQAMVAALLGAPTSFVGCVGQDRLGDKAVEWLLEAGVDIQYLKRSASRPTGVGFIMLDDSGVPAMVSSLGANVELDEKLVDQTLTELSSAQVLLTQFEIRPEVAICAAETARRLGMISIINPAPAVEIDIKQLTAADILVPNVSEANVLLGLNPGVEVDPMDVARRLLESTGAGCVLITLGERGVVGAEAKGTWQIFPPSVKVVDTSGAGDVFCGALAVGLAEGKSIKAAAEWACLVAAISVEKPGTIQSFPTREEVIRRFGKS
jgi:ribokinase